MFEILIQTISWCLLVTGALFYASGALGLLRFPDIYSRLHAVTKTDTVGLGFLTLGLVLQSGPGWTTAQLLLIWLLAMASAAVNGQLLARYTLEQEVPDDT
ncbi:monovalent cation/H(+) antiporter subunit G [Pseudohongiella spirulinae]|uniref:Cation:proton antiporter n=1 Tax=Pseudohongiella spirulinae TaxID=1249552 RepID=A0A0S2K9K5_9GAMM|nr:monovalent cation/H(+) antiporter subunit G [Pseudohongiella spirulinae]ALO45035.1 cation:proton antiporter [Pseudohongiella spirulinae]